MLGKYLTEFIGTFFLVLTIALAVQSENASIIAPIAIGGALVVLVYMGGHISGAHYNPAITLALFLRGKCSWLDVVPYMVIQIAAAVVATFAAEWMTGTIFLPAPGEGVDLVKAVANETLFTFLLALVILNVATSPRTEGNSYYGLAIGLTVLAAAFVGGGISGGAYNPAVGIGPVLANLVSASELSVDHFWIYLAGPFAGGILGAIVFHLQHFGEFGFSRDKVEAVAKENAEVVA